MLLYEKCVGRGVKRYFNVSIKWVAVIPIWNLLTTSKPNFAIENKPSFLLFILRKNMPRKR